MHQTLPFQRAEPGARLLEFTVNLFVRAAVRYSRKLSVTWIVISLLGLCFGLLNDLAVHIGWQTKHEAWLAIVIVLGFLSQPTISVPLYVFDALDLQNALMQNLQSTIHSSAGVADWLYVTIWGLVQWGLLVPVLIAAWTRMRDRKRRGKAVTP
jgi:hypothetical protein